MSAMFNNFTPLLMGRGASREVGQRIKAAGGSSVLLIHDEQLPASIIAPIRENLETAGLKCTVFCDLEAEIPDYCVERGVAAARQAGKVDFLLAVGGGSAMDCAKAVNLLLNNPPPLSQYFIKNGGRAEKAGYPIYAIPTTAGTGCEHTKAAVVCDSKDNGSKNPLVSEECFAISLAILDPELLLSLPKKQTAITGIDAFSHSYEAFTGMKELRTPLSNLVALDGMKLVIQYLPLAIQEPENVEYREKLLTAATLGGIASEMARGHMGHGFAHSIGSVIHAPHGVCVGSMMPFVAEAISGVRCEENREVLALFGYETAQLSPYEVGVKLREAMLAFMRKVGLPTLADYGATRQQLQKCAEISAGDRTMHRFRDEGKDMDMETITALFDQLGDALHLN